MAARVKVSVYLVFLVMAFGTVGLVSFQSLKERKSLTTLIVAKNKKIDELNNQYEELLDAAKKSLLQAKEDKENLIRKVKDLENDNMMYCTSCKQDKEKCESDKNKEVQGLREMLQARDIEIINTNAKIDQLKLNNKKVNSKKTIKLPKNNLIEKDQESFTKIIDDKGQSDKTIENPILQKVAPKDEKEDEIGSIGRDRNIDDEDEIEGAKKHQDRDVDDGKTINLDIERKL